MKLPPLLPTAFTPALVSRAGAVTLYIGPPTISDPQGSGPLLMALNWFQTVLPAAAVAVIAVAMIGFLMVTGRGRSSSGDSDLDH